MSAKNQEMWLFEAIVENIPTAIFVKEATELRFALFNKASEEFFGVTREEAHGKNDFDFFPREQATFFTEKDREVLSSGRPITVEEPIKTNQGDRWLLTKKVPLIDEAGQPCFLLGISLDITERRNAEQELQQTLAQLLTIEPLVQIGERAEGLGRRIIEALDAGDTAQARALAQELTEVSDGR
jgi:two-component system, cell cycle sensor histidine kinase and response regulator CckA